MLDCVLLCRFEFFLPALWSPWKLHSPFGLFYGKTRRPPQFNKGQSKFDTSNSLEAQSQQDKRREAATTSTVASSQEVVLFQPCSRSGPAKVQTSTSSQREEYPGNGRLLRKQEPNYRTFQECKDGSFWSWWCAHRAPSPLKVYRSTTLHRIFFKLLGLRDYSIIHFLSLQNYCP